MAYRSEPDDIQLMMLDEDMEDMDALADLYAPGGQFYTPSLPASGGYNTLSIIHDDSCEVALYPAQPIIANSMSPAKPACDQYSIDQPLTPEYLHKLLVSNTRRGAYYTVSTSSLPFQPWAPLPAKFRPMESRTCHRSYSRVHRLVCGHTVVVERAAEVCSTNCIGMTMQYEAQMEKKIHAKTAIATAAAARFGFPRCPDFLSQMDCPQVRQGEFGCTECRFAGSRKSYPTHVYKNAAMWLHIVIPIRMPRDEKVVDALRTGMVPKQRAHNSGRGRGRKHQHGKPFHVGRDMSRPRTPSAPRLMRGAWRLGRATFSRVERQVGFDRRREKERVLAQTVEEDTAEIMEGIMKL